MSLRAVSIIALLGLAACAAEERPQGASLSTELESGDVTTVGFATTTEPTKAASRVCAPGTARDCKLYTPGEAGTWNCFPSTQACRSDGAGWHACGDTAAAAADPAPVPVPVPVPAPAEEDAGTPELVH